MRSTRRHLKHICRRPGDGDYEEIIGKYLVRYRHPEGDRVHWAVIIRHREFYGEPLSGQYLTIEGVSGRHFDSLGDARLAAHANYTKPPKPITTGDQQQVLA